MRGRAEESPGAPQGRLGASQPRVDAASPRWWSPYRRVSAIRCLELSARLGSARGSWELYIPFFFSLKGLSHRATLQILFSFRPSLSREVSFHFFLSFFDRRVESSGEEWGGRVPV